MKPVLLVLIPLSRFFIDQLEQQFEVLHAPSKQGAPEMIAARHADIQIVYTNGTTGITAAEIDSLPALRYIGVYGAGFELVDVEHARKRSITVTNGSGTNDDSVADHAFALLLAAVRKIREYDQACREGVWREALPMQPQLTGKRFGVVGLGTIGRKIARRAEGFDMEIGYHNRKPNSAAPDSYTYFDRLDALATWADILVMATPGGAGTRHLVNQTILKALGPRGYLVNIARGSVVDTDAIAAALKDGGIAGAGLDVYEGEPEAPTKLLDCPNLVLSPHLGGRAPEAMQAAVSLFLNNAARQLAGEPVTNQI
jgi:D-3-phosphoglycerate dehydrogenase